MGFEAQCGVLTVGQALTLLSRGEIRARLASGQWRRMYHRVLITHNGELTYEQRLWACVLAAPPGSALAGPTAAALGGLRGFETDRLWLAIPRGRRKPTLPDVLIQTSGQLGPDDVHPAREPRRTTLERSVLDMASSAPSPAAARAPLLASVQQRLTVPKRLRSTLDKRGPRRMRSLIVETIDDAEGGVHSVPELEFARIVRRRGLPRPVRQRVVRGKDGRYYLDAAWDALGVSVEVHGAQHLEIHTWDADLDRCNELIIAGRRVLQFSSYAVRHHPERVGDQLERALRQQLAA